MKLILDKGADINARTTLGWTALMFASAGGKLWNAKLLVARGADLNAADKKGRTALSLAQSNHHTGVATLLKEFRAVADHPRPEKHEQGSFQRRPVTETESSWKRLRQTE